MVVSNLRGIDMTPNASLIVTLGIPTLGVIAFALIAYAIHRVSDDSGRYARLFAIGASTWLVLTGVLASAGFFARFDSMPPRFLIVFLPMMIGPLWLARSRVGELLADRVPLVWLIGFHAFRLPLELVMHEAAATGTMPPQMTYTGLNFDIVTGGTAIAVALLAGFDAAPRWLIAAWNLLGSLLLLNIMTIAIASLPMFRAFGSDAAHVNSWVAYFPFVWLPAALVTSALFGHAVLWRKLLRDARARSSSELAQA
jgi:hypothetical protein